MPALAPAATAPENEGVEVLQPAQGRRQLHHTLGSQLVVAVNVARARAQSAPGRDRPHQPIARFIPAHWPPRTIMQ